MVEPSAEDISTVLFVTSPNDQVALPHSLLTATPLNGTKHNIALGMNGENIFIITGTGFSSPSDSSLVISYEQSGLQDTVTPLGPTTSPQSCVVFIDPVEVPTHIFGPLVFIRNDPFIDSDGF